MMISIGDKAPEFNVSINGGAQFTLADAAGKNLVLYFYPKDDTPGCTKEAISFSENLDTFKDQNTVILGISRDTASKHDKFITKFDLRINLISDEDGSLCEAFGTWVEKQMYGRTYMGIERATFLINNRGEVAQIWRKVKVPGHVEDVLATVKALNS
jgi:peroxiredoxin Q/BCP|tara:strand:+ start:376 stop:846 length:471 start_codon:yes stop_codon:yes gene_type:complete